MSTEQRDNSNRPKTDDESDDREAMSEGYVPDSQLPEDLRPDEEENPLATNADEAGGDEEDEEGGAAGEPGHGQG